MIEPSDIIVLESIVHRYLLENLKFKTVKDEDNRYIIVSLKDNYLTEFKINF